MLGVVLKWGPQGMDGIRPLQAWGRVSLEVVGVLDPPAERHVTSFTEHEVDHAIAVTSVQGHADVPAVGRLLDQDFAGQWYEIVQQACIAWTHGDQVTFFGAVDTLQNRGGRARFGRDLLAALIQPPATIQITANGQQLNLLDALNLDIGKLGNAENAILGGAAIAMGRPGVARGIAVHFDRLQRPYQRALANALRILVGDTSSILSLHADT